MFVCFWLFAFSVLLCFYGWLLLVALFWVLVDCVVNSVDLFLFVAFYLFMFVCYFIYLDWLFGLLFVDLWGKFVVFVVGGMLVFLVLSQLVVFCLHILFACVGCFRWLL